MNSPYSSTVSLVSRIPYLAEIDADAKRTISTLSEPIYDWRKGRLLIDEGDPPSQAFIIVSGIVEITTAESTLPFTIGAGSIIGADNLLFETPSTYSATAVTPCHLISLDRRFATMAHNLGNVQKAIINALNAQKSKQEAYYRLILKTSKMGRTAVVLRSIAAAIDTHIVEDDPITFPYPVSWWQSQNEIAAVVDVCRPKVSEALHILAKYDAVFFEIREGKIKLPLVLLKGCIPKIDGLLKLI